MKARIALALCTVLALAGCGGDEPAAPVAAAAPAVVDAPIPEPAPAMLMTEQQARDALGAVQDAERRHDVDALAALFADNLQVTLNPLPNSGQAPKVMGKADYVAHLRKQAAKSAGSEMATHLGMFKIRTDGGQASGVVTASTKMSVAGHMLVQSAEQIYTVAPQAPDNAPKVVALVETDLGVSADGH